MVISRAKIQRGGGQRTVAARGRTGPGVGVRGAAGRSKAVGLANDSAPIATSPVGMTPWDSWRSVGPGFRPAAGVVFDDRLDPCVIDRVADPPGDSGVQRGA